MAYSLSFVSNMNNSSSSDEIIFSLILWIVYRQIYTLDLPGSRILKPCYTVLLACVQ